MKNGYTYHAVDRTDAGEASTGNLSGYITADAIRCGLAQ